MKAGKVVLFALVWLAVFAVGVSIWKLVIQPMQEVATAEQAKRAEAEILEQSTGNSTYKNQLTIAADSFSGYAILRSDEFNQLLAQRGIRVKIEDDQADYNARLKGLADGNYAMAAFPIDALIKASAETNQLPATIVCIIDESKGADAIVANKAKFPDVDSMNSAETKFILVGNSPSETLTRVVMHDFDLPKISEQPFNRVNSAEEVLKLYRNAAPSSSQLYVTWEPYVSQLLVDPEMHVVVNSSRFTGYIVDALVVSRNYLVKNQATVEDVLECYFSALYSFRNTDAMVELVITDAKRSGTTLTRKQAETLVSTIQWKNTQENFAHMGLREGKVLPLENIIERVMHVLQSTKAIPSDPTAGQLTKLFYDASLAQLQTRKFHPGLDSESILEQGELPALDDSQWNQLVSVGTLSVPDLVFARGSANLTDSSRSTLDELANKLQSWPDYYLRIRGSATKQGNDLQANQELATRRAMAAEDYLRSLGVSSNRMRVFDGETSGQTRVSFELGQASF